MNIGSEKRRDHDEKVVEIEMSEKRCYTVQELQEILGVSRSTIYNRC